jgi:hypothetical protein
MKKILGAAVAAIAFVVVQAHTTVAQTPSSPNQPPAVIIVPAPAPVIVAPAPAPVVVVPAPTVVAPAASPATVTVITTTVAPQLPFCGGAYRVDAGTNFGGC